MTNGTGWLVTAVLFLLAATASGDEFPQPRNTEPDLSIPLMPAQEAAARMQVPDGFQVSVFAAEPDVQNPIAMSWDQRGRLWIAENYTYAERAQRFDLSLRDRVLIFEDADGDGQPESRKVFTDDVQMLTSVETGRGGVWLLCPPQLLFLPDQNGDDVPDGPAQVVLDGFTVAPNNYHNYANGLRWGPDGWLYGRCGHSCPGRLGVPGTPDELRVPLHGGLWRFHPDRGVVEVLVHGTTNPWGHDWDRNGELFFINTVNGHLWHVLPGAHFKESFGASRNPLVYDRLDTIADHYHFDTNGRWSDSRDGKANDFGGGHAHIGMMIYQGSEWPEAYHNRLFTLNMHGRRTNVERLERAGAGFAGRHEPDVFLSADHWFRGLDLSTGPDGSVYVLDWSDTGECHEHTGVHRTSGRIFRISYRGTVSQPGDVSQLGAGATTATVRDTARSQRPFLTPRCLMGDGLLPKLWQQYQRGETTPERLRGLLRDPDENVRVQGIRLLTDHWPLDTYFGPLPGAEYPADPATSAELLRLATQDESGLVLLALASTLQRRPVTERAALAGELVARSEFATDPQLPALIWYGLIPVAESEPAVLVELASRCRMPLTLRWIARFLGGRMERSPGLVNDLLAESVSRALPFRVAVLLGLQEAFHGWRKAPQPTVWPQFAATLTSSSDSKPDSKTSAKPDSKPQTELENGVELASAIRELNVLFGDGRALDEIHQTVLDRSLHAATRQKALQTLIDAQVPGLRPLCESLLNERTLNATAVRGLALFDDPAIGRRLATTYQKFAPDERPAVLDTLVARPAFARELLARVGSEPDQIPRNDLTTLHARQILAFKNDALERQLSAVWGVLRDSPAEKQQLIAALKQRLNGEILARADLPNGRRLFQKNCSTCHKLYGDGQPVGPDLTGSQRSNLDYLLQNIVDPSALVAANYRVSLLTLSDGRVLTGLVAARAEQTLTVQTATELRLIPRSDVDDEQPSPISVMPDNLLQKLSDADVRDLIAYLMNSAQVPLQPEHEPSSRDPK